jgi:hypothetical protein
MCTKAYQKYREKDPRKEYETTEARCYVARVYQARARAERLFRKEGICGFIGSPTAERLRGLFSLDEFDKKRCLLQEGSFGGVSMERVHFMAKSWPGVSFYGVPVEKRISRYCNENLLQDLLTIDVMAKETRGYHMDGDEVVLVSKALWYALQSIVGYCEQCRVAGYHCSCI